MTGQSKCESIYTYLTHIEGFKKSIKERRRTWKHLQKIFFGRWRITLIWRKCSVGVKCTIAMPSLICMYICIFHICFSPFRNKPAASVHGSCRFPWKRFAVCSAPQQQDKQGHHSAAGALEDTSTSTQLHRWVPSHEPEWPDVGGATKVPHWLSGQRVSIMRDYRNAVV